MLRNEIRDALRKQGVFYFFQTPTLLNGWVNYGSGYSNVGYYKDKEDTFAKLNLQHTNNLLFYGLPTTMKCLFLPIFITVFGTAVAQPFPWNGYDIYDYLVTANHPQGCDPDYVTGLPNDSTWVNMIENTLMTGYFGMSWTDQIGDDLLLETSYHRDNYNVRLILSGGSFSSSFMVNEASWIQISSIQWQHIFTGCNLGQAFSERYILPLDFTTFGVGPGDVVIGIEITFVFTVGIPDLAGVYIIIPQCGMFTLGPDTTICQGETINIDATFPGATYLWQDGSTDAVYPNAGPGQYSVEVTVDNCITMDILNIFEATSTLDLGNDTLLCEGETLVLDATIPGATYLWQDNSTQSTFTVTNEGLYWVTTEEDDCMFTDSIQIDYADLPILDLGNDTSLCDGFTLLLDAFIPGATYEWQDNSTSSSFLVTDQGEYSVTVSLDGCTITEMIEVEYTYLEPVDLGDDIHLCFEETVLLDAFTPGGTYEWQDNSTLSNFTVNEPGFYSVTVSLDNCFTSDAIEVSYAQVIAIDLGDDIDLCPGETLLLDAFTPGATYVWQDNSTLSNFTVNEPGIYSVTVSLDNCFTSDTIEVSYLQEVVIDLGGDVNICPGESIILDATTPGATYLWQDNSTASTYNVTAAGDYSVIVQVHSCTSSDMITVAYVDEINIHLGNDTTLCQGETVTLDANTPGAIYQWQDNSTGSTLLVDQPGSYWVSVNLDGCISLDTIQVMYLVLSTSILGNDTTLCNGETLMLDAQNAGADYLWQNNSTASTLLVDQPGSYWVNVSLNNCSTRDTITIHYDYLTPITLGNDTTLCQGAALQLDANTSGTLLQWQDNSTGTTFLVTVPGIYWVSVQADNCSTADTIAVNYVSLPSIDLGNDTTLCEAQTLILDADSPGASYLWQDNSIASTLTVDQPGSYWLQVSVDDCSVADTIQVNYLVISSFDLGDDTTLCQEESLLLNATYPGASYQWQDNTISPTITVTQPGSYWVMINLGACLASDTINVAYNSLISIDLGNDTTLCKDQSLSLDATFTGASYEWQDGSTQSGFLVSEAGGYVVIVRVDQCAFTDTINITYLELSSIGLGSDTTLCWGETLTLHAEAPGAQYLWSDNSTAQILEVMQPGEYWVQVGLDNCAVADTIQVDFSDPVSIFLGQDTMLCPGETLILNAETTGASYTWQDNNGNTTYPVIQSGTYWVMVDVDGCIGSDTISVAYVLLPSIMLGHDTSLCEGETLLLNVSNPHVTYLWQDNSTNSTFLVSKVGEYSVTVSLDDCLTGDTIYVDYKVPVTFNLGMDVTLCMGETWLLDAQINDDVEYLWQDKSTTKTYDVTEPGLYWLQVEDYCGTYADTISIMLENCGCNIYVPNLFTPNGDNINDQLTPQSNCAITEYQFQIFDRDGGLLFETDAWGEGWDGNVNAKSAQVGVYVYALVYAFEDGKRMRTHGDVTVIR